MFGLHPVVPKCAAILLAFNLNSGPTAAAALERDVVITVGVKKHNLHHPGQHRVYRHFAAPKAHHVKRRHHSKRRLHRGKSFKIRRHHSFRRHQNKHFIYKAPKRHGHRLRKHKFYLKF